MSTRTVDQLDSWNTVPFSGGYSGLHDLADSEFSGAVIAGPARLFMLNGKVVGILDGSIDDFEDDSGTARKAPHPGLPLLAVMQEWSEEVRAKYYTEETPIADVDQTLSNGGFTGYVELSENVLSGDYYQIYHQGRSMSVAWVGNSDQLITEDEAFEQANDEVGIYEVRPVDIDIVDIPEPADSGGGAGGATDAGVAGGRTATGESTDDVAASGSTDDESATDPTPKPGDGVTPSGDSGAQTRGETDSTGSAGEQRPETDETPTRTASDPVAKTGTRATGERTTDSQRSQTEGTVPGGEDENARTDPEPTRQNDSGRTERTESQSDPNGTQPRSESSEPANRGRADQQGQPTDRGQADRRSQADQPARTGETARSQPEREPREQRNDTRPADSTAPSEQGRQSETESQSAGAGGVSAAPHDPSAGAGTDLETRSIPSLDPSHSGTAGSSSPINGSESVPTASSAESQPAEPIENPAGKHEQPATDRQSQQSPSQPHQDSNSRQTPADHPGAPSGQPETTRNDEPAAEQPAQRRGGAQSEPVADTEQVAELEAALEESEAERDQLQSDLDVLASERDDLQRELEEARAEIEQLESQIAETAAADDQTSDAETRLGEREAIDQTNLFVRYGSKGDATLEAVHSGNADQSAVEDNLQLEYHTQFDAASTAVGEQEFDSFLTESIQYRFVDWLVRSLLFEVRDTGNPEAMKELYDALPKIDRAELNGQISVEYTEDGETKRSQEQFDVVVRDRMGNPLIVANINDSRNPATDDMMTDLITRAQRVGSSSDSLAGAFLVTESFFEPPALETAEEATSSGLLSRDKRQSFINRSRKDGYHLCLVEARNQEFHLAVPEL